MFLVIYSVGFKYPVSNLTDELHVERQREIIKVSSFGIGNVERID